MNISCQSNLIGIEIIGSKDIIEAETVIAAALIHWFRDNGGI